MIAPQPVVLDAADSLACEWLTFPGSTGTAAQAIHVADQACFRLAAGDSVEAVRTAVMRAAEERRWVLEATKSRAAIMPEGIVADAQGVDWPTGAPAPVVNLATWKAKHGADPRL
jgi:hypothetical protein